MATFTLVHALLSVAQLFQKIPAESVGPNTL
jgi:hypothetical protein